MNIYYKENSFRWPFRLQRQVSQQPESGDGGVENSWSSVHTGRLKKLCPNDRIEQGQDRCTHQWGEKAGRPSHYLRPKTSLFLAYSQILLSTLGRVFPTQLILPENDLTDSPLGLSPSGFQV